MGSGHSQSDDEIISEFFGMIPSSYMNVGIDESLMMFSRTDSTFQLKGYSFNLQAQLIDDLPAFVEKVGGILQDLTPVPNAVGLGAFVISMILQMVFVSIKGSSSDGSGPSPMDMARRVFAEEKSSAVQDRMEEYLKCYMIYLYNDIRLLEETERLEKQLSLQVTRLRNSMLVDKQMSSHAVKHYVNGAAFHAQMLIHIARLRQGTVGFESAKTAASNTAGIYHRHMTEILEFYKEYRLGTFQLELKSHCHTTIDHDSFRRFRRATTTSCTYFCKFAETEIHYSETIDNKYCDLSSDSYLNHFFSNDKKLTEMRMYFGNLQNNLDVLANQTGKFVFEKYG